MYPIGQILGDRLRAENEIGPRRGRIVYDVETMPQLPQLPLLGADLTVKVKNVLDELIELHELRAN